MKTRREILKYSIGLTAFGLSGIGFPVIGEILSGDGDTDEFSTTLAYYSKSEIERILKSSKLGIKTAAKETRWKIPFSFDIKLIDGVLNKPLGNEYTALLISEDFYSRFRLNSDLTISSNGEINADTTIPTFKTLTKTTTIRSTFYLVVINGEKMSFTRVNINPNVLVANSKSFDDYKKVRVKQRSIVDKIVSENEGYSDDNDIFIYPEMDDGIAYKKMKVTVFG